MKGLMMKQSVEKMKKKSNKETEKKQRKLIAKLTLKTKLAKLGVRG